MWCWEPTALRGAGTQLLAMEVDAPAQRLRSTALLAEAAGGSSGQFAAEKGEKSSVSRCASAQVHVAHLSVTGIALQNFPPNPRVPAAKVLSRFLSEIPHAFVLPFKAEPIPKCNLKQKQDLKLPFEKPKQ